MFSLLRNTSPAALSRALQRPLWRALAAKAAKGKGAEEFEIPEFKTYEIDPAALPTKVSATRDELLHYYTEMSLVRRVEVVSDALYKQKLIRGFLHLCNGQEAVSTGFNAAMKKTDNMITAYRDHGWYIVRGGSVRSALAELCGRAEGCSGGKGGSMHF